jgi:hypothetical protein
MNLNNIIWQQIFGGTVDSNGKFINSSGGFQNPKTTKFSSDIKCAWQIVKAMKKNGYKFYLSDCITEDDKWMCYFLHVRSGRAPGKVQKYTEDENVCEAICFAAIEALKSKTKRFRKKPY